MAKAGLDAVLADPSNLDLRRSFARSKAAGPTRRRVVELEDELREPSLTREARRELVDERETLIARNATDWEPEVTRLAHTRIFSGYALTEIEFEHGLVSHVQVRGGDCEDLDALAHSGCYSLAMTIVEDEHLDRLLAGPLLPRLRRLELGLAFTNNNPDRVVEVLAKVGPLDRLVLENVVITPALAEAIAAHTSLRSLWLASSAGSGSLAGSSVAALTKLDALRLLTLRGQDLDAKALAKLLDGPFVAQLDHLGLSEHKLGAKGCKVIAGAELSSLRSLDLTGSTVGQYGVDIVASPKLAQLESLCLDASKISAKHLPALLDALALPRLRTLDLAGLRCKDAGAQAIAAGSEALARCGVTNLSLAGNALGDDGAEALAGAEGLAGIRRLAINHNGIRAEGIAALADSPLLRGLEALDVANNKIQTKGAQTLARSAAAATLRELDLGHNWIGSKGVQALFGADGVRELEAVWLGVDNNFGDAGVDALADSDIRLRNLAAGYQASPDSIRRLLESAASERLTRLQVYANVGEANYADLAAGRLGPKLHTVYVSSQGIDPALVAAFDRRFACSAQRGRESIEILPLTS